MKDGHSAHDACNLLLYADEDNEERSLLLYVDEDNEERSERFDNSSF